MKGVETLSEPKHVWILWIVILLPLSSTCLHLITKASSFGACGSCC